MYAGGESTPRERSATTRDPPPTSRASGDWDRNPIASATVLGRSNLPLPGPEICTPTSHGDVEARVQDRERSLSVVGGFPPTASGQWLLAMFRVDWPPK